MSTTGTFFGSFGWMLVTYEPAYNNARVACAMRGDYKNSARVAFAPGNQHAFFLRYACFKCHFGHLNNTSNSHYPCHLFLAAAFPAHGTFSLNNIRRDVSLNIIAAGIL